MNDRSENSQINNSDQEARNKAVDFLKWFIPIIVPIVCIIIESGTQLMLEKSRIEHERELINSEHEQSFYNNNSIMIDCLSMEYVQYNLTTDPTVSRYHVITYPYITYQKDNRKIYVPITGQFTQNEYVADGNGNCQLLRENTSAELAEKIKNIVQVPVEVKCLICVNYIDEKSSEKMIEVFDLKDGQLTPTEQDIADKVVKASESPNGSAKKINLWEWPSINQQEIQNILAYYESK